MLNTPCPICSQLRYTIERYPNSVCDKCGVKRTDFKNAFLNKQHYELHEDLELPCNYCPKTLPNKRKLKEHERQTHRTKKDKM